MFPGNLVANLTDISKELNLISFSAILGGYIEGLIVDVLFIEGYYKPFHPDSVGYRITQRRLPVDIKLIPLWMMTIHPNKVIQQGGAEKEFYTVELSDSSQISEEGFNDIFFMRFKIDDSYTNYIESERVVFTPSKNLTIFQEI